MAAFCSTTSARVSWSIAAAPSRNRSISNPSSAMGSKPTALITEVRPPTQSCIGKRASQSFSSACRSSSLPMPVTATACRAKSTRAARYFASASTIPLRVSFVPPDFEMTITSVSSRASFNFPHTRSKPSGSVLSKKNASIGSLAFPRASATNWGPSAEPPIPMSKR